MMVLGLTCCCWWVWLSRRSRSWIRRIVGCSAKAKAAADSEQPCVVPTLVVKECVVWLSSVHSVVEGLEYHVCVSWHRAGQR